MFNKIFNPQTQRFVDVGGKAGKRVINNYQNQLNIMTGGGEGKKKPDSKKKKSTKQRRE